VQHLGDDKIQYVLVRISDKKGGVETTRDVLINWIGPKVPILQRGKKSLYIEDVKKVLRPFHAALEGNSKEHFTEENVREKSHPLSGSHFLN